MADDQSDGSYHSASSFGQSMDQQLLEACSKGDLNFLSHLNELDILFSETPLGNNCLHIAAMLGHQRFAEKVWLRVPSLLSCTNLDGETPLIAALMAANATLASDMLDAALQLLQSDIEGGRPLNEMLLKIDERGDNALHHALRNGFTDLADRFLNIEPRLSEQANNIAESPMHMAARRGYSQVVERLLQIPSSADCGPGKYSALHAAVDAGHTDIIKQLLEGRPQLAYHVADDGRTPLVLATLINNLEIVKILLEHNPNLAYCKHKNTGETPFLVAAKKGFVPIAEEIISTCPDSAYTTNQKYSENALHMAIGHERAEFVGMILRTPKLHRLINQVDNRGDLPLHYAARVCDPKILRSLLSFKGVQDYTALNVKNLNAVDVVCKKDSLYLKTLKWNESFTLLSNAIPSGWRISAGDKAKKEIKKQAIQEVKGLTERYTSNTSLVAVLLASITFAAAFRLPAPSNSPSDTDLHVILRKAAYLAFLISDAIAMCSSLVVAFLCILATWEDLDYLLNYRKLTRFLMWCAYEATAVAFGTGFFTVMAPMLLAITMLVLCCILPFISKIIGDWPKIKLRLRVGRQFRSDLVSSI